MKDTRVLADALVSSFKAGSPVEEIAENYPGVPLEQIRELLTYAMARSKSKCNI